MKPRQTAAGFLVLAAMFAFVGCMEASLPASSGSALVNPAGLSAASDSNPGSVWNIALPDPAGAGYELRDVEWGGGRFVAVGVKGTILLSTDGYTWSSVASGTTRDLNGVAWMEPGVCWPGTFVAVGDSGIILFSWDGLEWETRAWGRENVHLRGVAAGPTGFTVIGTRLYETGPLSSPAPWPIPQAKPSAAACCVQERATEWVVLQSPDGFEWNAVRSGFGLPASLPLYASAQGPQGHLGAGTGVIFYDGNNSVLENGALTIRSAVWIDDGERSRWIAVGYSSTGTVYTSTDGIAWSKSAVLAPRLYAIVRAGDRRFMVGAGGSIFVSDSSDAIWSPVFGAPAANLYGLAWRPDEALEGTARLVAVGASGTILASP